MAINKTIIKDTVEITKDLELKKNKLKIDNTAVTSTATELNKLNGTTATTSDLNKLHNIEVTSTEVNELNGITSNVQEQINTKETIARVDALKGTGWNNQTVKGNADSIASIINSKASANGIATLDKNSKIPSAQIPSIALLDVHTVASKSAMLDLNVQKGDMAIRTDLNQVFILKESPATDINNWAELAALEPLVEAGLADLAGIGRTNETVKGNTTSLTAHKSDKNNPHTVTKAQVGLGSVNNTSDTNKPISTAQQNALNLKFDKVGGTITGVTSITNNTTSTSKTTGALKVTGGVGIAENLNVGGEINKLTLSSEVIGFTVEGGTTNSKTLTAVSDLIIGTIDTGNITLKSSSTGNTVIVGPSGGTTTLVNGTMVPTARKIAGKTLSSDITLNNFSVGVSGVGLSGTTVTYDGSSDKSITIKSNATSASEKNTIVSRDASKNFSAGTITAALAGNASSASKLATARKISLTGAVTGNIDFDGSSPVSIDTTATSDPKLTLSGDASGAATFTNLGDATLNVTVANDSHTHDTRYYTEAESDDLFVDVAGDTMSGKLTINNELQINANDGTDGFSLVYNKDSKSLDFNFVGV